MEGSSLQSTFQGNTWENLAKNTSLNQQVLYFYYYSVLLRFLTERFFLFLIWIHLPVEDYSKTCHQLMLLLAQTRYKVSVAVRTYGESSDAEARSTFTVWFIHLCVIRATWLCLACFSEHFFISFFMILISKSMSAIHLFPHSFLLSSRSLSSWL